MTILFGPDGEPISTPNLRLTPKAALAPVEFARRKSDEPLTGEISVGWGSGSKPFLRFWDDNVLQFDTSKLTLQDFRIMRSHYMINATLSILTFQLHQLEWTIQCDSAKVKKHVEWNLERIWTRLVRGLSQAFWAGYSPCALQWENDIEGKRRVITKIKDLNPEECTINWKQVDAVAKKLPGTGNASHKPKVNIFDGIRQAGYPVVPVENSLWYPLLMENGNMYGRRLLESAFQPWYFSLLIHLYANHYHERFGEPVPIGRAPYDDKLVIDGKEIQGNKFMASMIANIRNGSGVVLPNQKLPSGTELDKDYEYSMAYLESQMRGADFERHLQRLDEEMSLAIFMPVSALKSVSEGYNTGVAQLQVFYHTLNAISGDWAEYINKYLLWPMARFNFGERAAVPRIQFKRMGAIQQETMRAILTSLTQKQDIKFDTEQLSKISGLNLSEYRELTDPDPDSSLPENDTTRPQRVRVRGKGTDKTARVVGKIAARMAEQHGSSKHRGPLTMGHQRQLEEILGGNLEQFRHEADAWISDLAKIEDHLPTFQRVLEEGLTEQVGRYAAQPDAA